MKVAEVEKAIQDTAVRLANVKAQERFKTPEGPFVAGAGRSEGTGPFVLEISEPYFQKLNESDMDEYRSIAADAVREAIIQHKKDFAGVVGTYVIRGENYFDAFN